ncbi:MAG: L-threonylcarbamoyladenylate synthase [Bacteroidota bacterium]|jgi:tRNA threonylcarbamoyl adenosine modification protein (Sua5/YciO/YrdC/YwlC family)
MLIELHPKNPNPRELKRVIDALNTDQVIILPTDTIYAMGCKLNSKKALETMCRIAGKKPEKVHFSLLCSDLSHLSEYTAPLDKSTFRLMKNNLPGPFTFIVQANKQVTKWFAGNKKTIGIRVPDHVIAQTIVAQLEYPLLVSTIHHDDTILEYMTDPQEIAEKFRHQVSLVIDGGAGGHEPSTIVDCTGSEPVILRQGKGVLAH